MDLNRRNDEELLVRAREEPQAFSASYARHVRAVQAYFGRRVGDPETAFDLTAETFAAALRSVPRYEPRPEPARAWLFAIARNTLSEALRRGRVQDEARRALAMEPVALGDADVESLALLAETPALEALADLPEEQQAVVAARHLDEESYAEIAARLECSESVVRQRVSRGLRTLRTQLGGDRG